MGIITFQWRADTLRRDHASVAMRWSDYSGKVKIQILLLGVFSSKGNTTLFLCLYICFFTFFFEKLAYILKKLYLCTFILEK